MVKQNMVRQNMIKKNMKKFEMRGGKGAWEQRTVCAKNRGERKNST